MKPPKGMDDPRLAKALCRYEVISQYLAQKPKRGVKKKLLERLSRKQWVGPDGTFFTASAETIRAWARRYRRSGLSGLMDKERTKRGVTVLTEEQQDIICGLKEDVPGVESQIVLTAEEANNLTGQSVLHSPCLKTKLQKYGENPA